MMHRSGARFFSFIAGSCLVVACSSSGSQSGFGDTPSGGSGSGSDSGSGSGDGGAVGNGGGAGGNYGGNLNDGAAMDNGCVPNPANYDIPGNKCDDDGDGVVDNPPASCDTGVIGATDGPSFAKALGLCQQAGGGKWGLVSAIFSSGYGTNNPPNAAQHGILGQFGSTIKPREGSSLGVISSGSATEQDSDTGPAGDENGAFKGVKNGMQSGGGGPPPPNYPKAAAGCLGAKNVNDMVDVKLTIQVPANAKGLSFDFNFYSGEWPEYVCTPYNDAFVTFLHSSAFNGGVADNVSFDSNKNPVSVNNGFFQVCTDKVTTGCSGGSKKTSSCPLGPGDLAGTGFDDPGTYCSQPSTGGGSTGWLSTQAPVKPGETITLDFMVWDTGDNSWDSSALIDNFKWIPGDTAPGTTRPPPK